MAVTFSNLFLVVAENEENMFLFFTSVDLYLLHICESICMKLFEWLTFTVCLHFLKASPTGCLVRQTVYSRRDTGFGK